MLVSPMRRRCAPFFVPLAFMAAQAPAPAVAYESEVEASVAAQYYGFESPYGEPLIRRRRYTETLGFSLYDLQGERKPGGPSLSFRTRLRLDADLGQDPGERDPASDRFIPGLEQAPLDLMYAYLDGQRYFGGVFGFRIGRQYVADVLGWWSFDGGLASVTTPAYVRMEAYAGLEQRSGLPLLGTPRYQADGVARGSREDMSRDQWTSYLEQSRVAPAFGIALESTGLDFMHARLSYRRVVNQDSVVVSPFADENGLFRRISQTRVSTEKAGGTLRFDASELGAIFGSGVYDLYTQLVSDAALGFDWYVTPRLTAGAEIERYVPTFDGDSIFNWFSQGTQTSLTARASLAVSRRLDFGATGGARLFETLGDPADFAETRSEADTTRELDPFATLAGRYRFHDGSIGVRTELEAGSHGHRVGGDITTVKTYEAGYYDTRVVLSLYDFRDDLRPERYATSFSYVLGAGVSPGLDFLNRGRLGVEWEHAMNRLVGQRYRVLATLDFSVLR
jgi:hypothetical protein